MMQGARVARHLLTAGRAASSRIASIEATGRGTLVEMRRLIGVLRDSGEAAVWDGLIGMSDQGHRSLASGMPPPTQIVFGGRSHARWDAVIRAHAGTAPRWVPDALVVLAFACFAAGEPLWDSGFHSTIGFVLAAIVVGVLLFRRTAPLLACLTVAATIFASNVWLGGDPWVADLAILLAIYSVATLVPRWGLAALAVGIVAYAPLWARSGCEWGVCVLSWTLEMSFAVVAGVAIREGRRLNAELEQQTEMLRKTRAERVRLAVASERTRIARDVHDLVAHGVSLMVIQAGAARWLTESDPHRAAEALGSVEAAGQEALCELHNLVGALDTVPTNGADPLPEGGGPSVISLVDGEVVAGMRVELITHGEPHELDAGLELSLYRIVQEALTNVRKHAPGASARVELTYTRESVEVDVTDSGRCATAALESGVPGARQGLIGIEERSALFGGHFEAGPTPKGGFRVRVSLKRDLVPA
jgi:signal transduction histidine kinase